MCELTYKLNEVVLAEVPWRLVLVYHCFALFMLFYVALEEIER